MRMNKLTKHILTTSASLAFAGALMVAKPSVASAEEYSTEAWTPRTVNEIKSELDNMGEKGTNYTFQWGDTLSAVANATDVSVDKLVKINGINDANLIFAGNKIHLSGDQKTVTVEKNNEVVSYNISEENEEVTEVETPVEVKETVKSKKEEPVKEEKAAEKSEEKVSEKTEEPAKTEEVAAPQGKTIVVEATAYSTNQPSLSDYTYTGINLRENPNVIAVDPSVIPLGSKVNVPGFGVFIAGDTGSAIKGNRIDIHITNLQSAINFGRKQMEVTIVQ